jgi:hypothetical protein
MASERATVSAWARRADEQIREFTPGMELREHIDERRARLKAMQPRQWKRLWLRARAWLAS